MLLYIVGLLISCKLQIPGFRDENFYIYEIPGSGRAKGGDINIPLICITCKALLQALQPAFESDKFKLTLNIT